MSKLLELKEKRNHAWQQAKTFLDSVRSEDGLVSEEDSKRYDDMEAKINLYNQEIARLERQEKIDLELSQPASQALIGQPTTVLNDKTTEEEKKGVASDSYAKTFLRSFFAPAPAGRNAPVGCRGPGPWPARRTADGKRRPCGA